VSASLLVIAALAGTIALSGCKNAAEKSAQASQHTSTETSSDSFAHQRNEILRSSAVRVSRPDTITRFDIERLPSLHVKKVLVTQGPDIEAIANYFAAHPELGEGDVHLELATGKMAADERRVVVSLGLNLGTMGDTIERVLRVSPFDMTIFVSNDATIFRIHWLDTFGSRLLDDIINVPFDTYSFEEREDLSLTKIAPHWYYQDSISL
jgi:hypothetical protein